MTEQARDEVARWAAENGFTCGAADTLSTLLAHLSAQLKDERAKSEDATTQADAAKVQLASIRKLCEAGWTRHQPCPLCKHVGRHSEVCYAREATGYDLLCEHEATLRENDELRAALAVRLPVNGKHLLAGAKHVSLRDRVRGRFSRHEG